MNHKYTLRNLQQHAYTLSSFMGVYLRTYPASCTLESCVGGGDDPWQEEVPVIMLLSQSSQDC